MRAILMLPAVFVVANLSTLAVSQSVSLSAPTAVTLNASSNGLPQTSTLAAGALPNLGSQTATSASSAGTASAMLSWSSYASDTEIGVEVTVQCVATATGQASCPPGDILVSLATPFVASAQVELVKEVGGVATALLPVTRVDIGDDGSAELTEQQSVNPLPIPVVLGPTPLLVRCTLGAQIVGPGGVLGKVRMRVVARDTFVAPWVSGCGEQLFVAARLDGGIGTFYAPTAFGISGIVFGLSAQPTLLGFAQGTPCLLLPQPDLVMLGSVWSPVTVTVPPAARPVDVYVQAVTLSAAGFVVSPGYAVAAR